MFKDLNLKQVYDSDQDDILNQFYIPVLKESRSYKRITGFFSSSSLSLAARGIAHFISNNGTYQLITSVVISEQDYKAILTGIKQADQIISPKIDFALETLSETIEIDYLKILSWLIATKKLQIKIAVLPESSSGLFHEKIGIFEDKDNNLLSFSGSINESKQGWLNNIEEFKVFKSWSKSELTYLQRDVKKFEKYWNNLSNNFIVVELPEAIAKCFLKIQPNEKEINILIDRVMKNESNKKILLRDYQKGAILNWVNNDYKGIFEMATGTGKTLTALGAIEVVQKEKKRYCAIIAVPYTHLAKQWLQDITVLLSKSFIVECYGDIPNWRNKLKQAITNYDDEFFNDVVVITTYDTLSSSSFLNTINSIGNLTSPYILIADEMHNLGAPTFSKSMVATFSMRLGLSATPTRWFDELGTKQLFDYFKKVVFSYTLKQAIADNILTHYDYFPLLAVMSGDELKKYKELTYKIIKNTRSKEANLENIYLKTLLLKRSKIIKNNADKLNQFKKLIEDLKQKDKISHLLVYCDSSDQMDQAQKILNEFSIINHKFTERETLKERGSILENFDRGTYQCLVAIKCLDEGVNIPSTQTAVILASSSNPREYIQRRGRILRKFPSKNKATIYDFIVMPPVDSLDANLMKVEQKILKKEYGKN